MLASLVVSGFKQRIGLFFIWLLSLASVSLYLTITSNTQSKRVSVRPDLSYGKVINWTLQSSDGGGGVGYMLAGHYSDQLTGASSNLLSLQCWASTLPGRITVVEPFLHLGSLLGVSLDEKVTRTSSENTVKLTQVYDEAAWVSHASKYGYSPLVSWEHFINHAPRKLILVDKACSNTSLICMQCNNGFYKSDVFLFSAMEFARTHGFKVVRRVCYKLMTYSDEEFQKLVYGPYNPGQMVVLFNHFGGIVGSRDRFRVLIRGINGRRCTRRLNFIIANSLQIIQESAIYVEKFMPEAIMDGYISVMVRMEHFSISEELAVMSREHQLSKIFSCVNSIAMKVENLKEKTGISSVFITTDVGKYGPIDLKKLDNIHLHDEVLRTGLNQLYSLLFGNSAQLEDITNRIDAVTSVQNSGYVASLEKNLAASGACLVLAGGGFFQKETSDLYYHYHKNRRYRACSVSRISECTL